MSIAAPSGFLTSGPSEKRVGGMIERGSLDPAGQSEYVYKGVIVIARSLPEDWEEFKFRFDALHGCSTGRGIVGYSDGAWEEMNVPLQVLSVLDDLRVGMYVENKGTWFSMLVLCKKSEGYEVKYNYKSKPAFDIEPVSETYVEDLKYFPRGLDFIPEWLQGKIDELQSGS
ncbi:hypothetical protein [Nocardiopsis potens]|uniref:hypothetical protein n=1 Tax=Nocardiopsis potens TaxID=1246458 RepID=UPI001267E361|nr:hypothetical protein [Nocardiopsis potens]